MLTLFNFTSDNIQQSTMSEASVDVTAEKTNEDKLHTITGYEFIDLLAKFNGDARRFVLCQGLLDKFYEIIDSELTLMLAYFQDENYRYQVYEQFYPKLKIITACWAGFILAQFTNEEVRMAIFNQFKHKLVSLTAHENARILCQFSDNKNNETVKQYLQTKLVTESQIGPESTKESTGIARNYESNGFFELCKIPPDLPLVVKRPKMSLL